MAILDAQVHGAWNDYPVNALRNLALQQVQTTHILYIDVDFWTSEDLYETILGEEAELRSSSSSSQNRGARQPKAVLTNASLPSTPVLSHSILSSAARIALFNDPKQALVVSVFLTRVLFACAWCIMQLSPSHSNNSVFVCVSIFCFVFYYLLLSFDGFIRSNS